MILAMLLLTARAVRRRRAGLCLLLSLSATAAAQAQAPANGDPAAPVGAFVPYRAAAGLAPMGSNGPPTSLAIPSRPMGFFPGTAGLGLRDGVATLHPAELRGGPRPSPILVAPSTTNRARSPRRRLAPVSRPLLHPSDAKAQKPPIAERLISAP